MHEGALFVSVKRFAEMVGLSERNCWNLIQAGVLPAWRIGRRTLLKPQEAVAALEEAARRQLAGSPEPPDDC